MSIFEKKPINGQYSLTSEIPPSYNLEDLSLFRIQFSRSENSITPYVSCRFCVVTAEETKILLGLFRDSNNNEFTIIQIPLLGQTIDDVIRVLNSYSEISAEVVNSAGFTSSLLIKDTYFGDASGKWIYFSSESIDVNSTYSSFDKDIRFYLTTPEPVSVQKNLPQSLGGYVSSSEIYRSTLLSSPVSIYDTVIYVNAQVISSNFSLLDLQKNPYIQINDEIIKISKWTGNVGYISERNSFDTPLRMHPKDSIVREINKNDFFDLNFNSEGKQYRCVAIKNVSTKNIAKNLKVFLNLISRNNLSSVKIAIECPSSDYFDGVVSSGGISTFYVPELKNKFDNLHFIGCPVVFTSGLNNGQARIVKSYNPTSGTLEIDQRLPNNISQGDKFYIDTSPSFKTKSGMTFPTGPNISDFFNANNELNAIPINIGKNRLSGSDLRQNEVIYIWLERSISESSDEFINNRCSLSLVYNRT